MTDNELARLEHHAARLFGQRIGLETSFAYLLRALAENPATAHLPDQFAARWAIESKRLRFDVSPRAESLQQPLVDGLRYVELFLARYPTLRDEANASEYKIFATCLECNITLDGTIHDACPDCGTVEWLTLIMV
ncbi:hypothetical protein [Candidatus Poriferisodalis sp.]|uniref:hypothetical protein n=1 Tax=Candidatus Poriferisodalis sp. TaxID=3101277 RepID=UPI003B5AC4F6